MDDYVVKAAALHAQGRLQEARDLLTRARAMVATRADVHFNLGLYCGEAGDPAAAAACFMEAVRIRPDWVDAHIYLVANTLQAGDVARALELLETAFKVAPGNASLNEQLAIATERKLAQVQAGGNAVELEQALGYLQSAVGNLKAISLEPAMDGDTARARRYIEMLSRVRGAVERAESFLAREPRDGIRSRAQGGARPRISRLHRPVDDAEVRKRVRVDGAHDGAEPQADSREQRGDVRGDRCRAPRARCTRGIRHHGHMRCTETSGVLLSKYVDRLVVKVRDPRQPWFPGFITGRPGYPGSPDAASVGQRFGHVVRGAGGLLHRRLLRPPGEVPAELGGCRERQGIPASDAHHAPGGLRVAPREFFLRILDFYDLDPALFQFPEPPTAGERHFRRGEADEWRQALRPAQIERMQAMFRTRYWRDSAGSVDRLGDAAMSCETV